MRRKGDTPPLRIGTAGWGVPSRYIDRLPKEGSHLERYARALNAVEINSSFHRSHRRAVYARWAAVTPPEFRFAVKVPKTITHEHGLVGCASLIGQFAEETAGLGDKLGALLVQLPPSAALKRGVAERFFRQLRRAIDVPIALEPRHVSWFAPTVDSWLTDRKIARVAADPVPRRVPAEAAADRPGGWPGFVYYRWHGSPRIYFSDYPPARLQALNRRLAAERKRGIPVWCIFDNTGGGHALGNALRLADAGL